VYAEASHLPYMVARSRSGEYANITQGFPFRSKRLGQVNCGWAWQP